MNHHIIPRSENQDLLRPRLHFTAPHGWINDPVGLIFYKGDYHLFYQYNGDILDWSRVQICWGHAVSRDLIHWNDLPIALTPTEPYETDPETGGCFSGSAIEWQDRMYLFYTGSVTKGTDVCQTQNMAWSEDGVHFTKYEGNPVIKGPPSFGRNDFRDPKVFRHGDFFYMVVAGCVGETEDSAAACVYLYRSSDLISWEYRSILAGPTRNYGAMIECPDFFPLGSRWVLSACLMKNNSYKSNVFFVGDMDFDTDRFTIRSVQEQDPGGYWYAPQTFSGSGLTIQMSWQNTCLWMQWFDDWGPTRQEGWRSCLSLPHILTLDDHDRVCSCPISLESLMKTDMTVRCLSLNSKPHFLYASDPGCYELSFDLDPGRCFSGMVELGIAGYGQRHTKLTIDLTKDLLILDIRDSRHTLGSGITVSQLPKAASYHFRIQFDRSSLEIIVNENWHQVACIYPEPNQTELWIRSPYTESEVQNLKLQSLIRDP